MMVDLEADLQDIIMEEMADLTEVMAAMLQVSEQMEAVQIELVRGVRAKALLPDISVKKTAHYMQVVAVVKVAISLLMYLEEQEEMEEVGVVLAVGMIGITMDTMLYLQLGN